MTDGQRIRRPKHSMVGEMEAMTQPNAEAINLNEPGRVTGQVLSSQFRAHQGSVGGRA